MSSGAPVERGDGTRKRCPLDGTALGPASHGGVAIERCATCGGVWLAAGELAQIELEVRAHPAPAPDPLHVVLEAEREALEKQRAELACPGCGLPTEKREYAYCSQVLIDTCPACGGVWLDGGELTEVERFLSELDDGPGPWLQFQDWLQGLIL